MKGFIYIGLIAISVCAGLLAFRMGAAMFDSMLFGFLVAVLLLFGPTQIFRRKRIPKEPPEES